MWLRWLYAVGFIYLPGKPGFVPLLLCSLMLCANSRVHYDLMVVFVCLHITLLHYHYYADVYESIGLLNCFWGSLFRVCVSKIKSILSIISHAIYGTVCSQHTHFCFDLCEDTYTSSYYHHQIGSMNHLPLFRFRSWSNGMRCMSFYVLIALAIQVALHPVAPFQTASDSRPTDNVSKEYYGPWWW